jgi:hypothetical protein
MMLCGLTRSALQSRAGQTELQTSRVSELDSGELVFDTFQFGPEKLSRNQALWGRWAGDFGCGRQMILPNFALLDDTPSLFLLSIDVYKESVGAYGTSAWLGLGDEFSGMDVA